MKKALFGTSGIRGVVNVEFTTELAMKVGLALANFTGTGKVAIGFDTRLSSPMIAKSLMVGLLSGGAEIKNHGLIPTPVLAYLTLDGGCHAGAMVTASHNPPEYNGIKLFDKDGMAFTYDLQNRFEELVNYQDLSSVNWEDLQTVESIDCTYKYVEMIRNKIVLGKQWKVVIDPGCGAAYSLAPRLFREQGCRVLSINAQPDGHFPGRIPEPNAESLNDLSRIVKESNSNAGIAYDGDADRMALVDETGILVPMDQLIAAYGANLVSTSNEKTIVVPVDASMCIEESIEEAGGKVIRTSVGDVNVAEAVLKHKAAFGAETSGAWITPKYHLCPDGILSSLLVIEKVSNEQSNTISKFISSIPQYPLIRKKIPCPYNLQSRVINEVQSELSQIMPEVNEILTIDGVRISNPKGWILVRSSGTEPVLRITVEVKDQTRVNSLMSHTTAIIQDIVKRLSN